MLRFPNPGSDISSFIRIFSEIDSVLSNRGEYDLDDITGALIERNLVASSGYTGKEALRRSTRKDRSRDPLYNQSKMYAELFRTLGWMSSLSDSSLRFRTTPLGAHVSVAATGDAVQIFRESVLGIAYPNPVLNVKGDGVIRPFAAILRTIAALDGFLCRDEMIVGPLSLSNDRDTDTFQEMVSWIHGLRGRYANLVAALNELSAKRGITKTTMGNYTRFPLAVLLWCGWTEKVRKRDLYGRSLVFHNLTDQGWEQASQIEQSADVRGHDLQEFPGNEVSAFAKLSHYRMLERSGFDVSPLAEEVDALSEECADLLAQLGAAEKSVIFSPFQELSPGDTESIFGIQSSVDSSDREEEDASTIHIETPSGLNTDITLEPIAVEAPALNDELQSTLKAVGGKIDAAVEIYAAQCETMDQAGFYPLVGDLFNSIGYDCRVSRPGVNYERWDAMIVDEARSMPIEIKSPGEELFLSVKAVRQALENKVVLLNRQAHPTTPNTASLVVGYNLPNSRSEVAQLIDDIRTVYNVSIGVIDFRSLLSMALLVTQAKRRPMVGSLEDMCGFLQIKNS